MWLDPETQGEFDVAIGAQVKAVRGQEVQIVDDDKQVSHAHLTVVMQSLPRAASLAMACEQVV